MPGEGSLRQLLGDLFGQSSPIDQIDLLGVEIDVGPDCSGLDLAACHRTFDSAWASRE